LADFSLGIREKSDPRKVLSMDILLVDDNPDYLLLVREALYSHGYTVHTAQDGIEGCEVLASSDIDLIISDIRMPRFDGLKLHAFAREMERYKDTKFVFVSGIKGAYQDVVNINPRIDFFLEKTTSLKDIIKFVDTLVFGRYEGEWV
jgi:CheY-like chemotaxis protein